MLDKIKAAGYAAAFMNSPYQMRFLLPTDPDFLSISGYGGNYPQDAKEEGDLILSTCHPGPITKKIAVVLEQYFGPDLIDVILEYSPAVRCGPFGAFHEVYFETNENNTFAAGILDVDLVVQCRNNHNAIFHVILPRGTRVNDVWLQNKTWRIAYPVWGKITGPPPPIER